MEEARCKQASLRVDQGRTGGAFFPPGGSIVSDVQRRGFLLLLLLLPPDRAEDAVHGETRLSGLRQRRPSAFHVQLDHNLQAVVGGVGMPGLLAGGFHKLEGL